MRKVTEPQSLEPSAFFQWYNCIFPYSKFLKISLFILYNLKISRTIISSFHLSIANSKLVHHSFCKRKVLWPCAVKGPIVVVSLEWKHMQRTSFYDKNKQEKRNMIELVFVCRIIGSHGSVEEEFLENIISFLVMGNSVCIVSPS